MNNININRLVCGLFLFWGVITGRSLPQWEDIANSPYWFGEALIYWVMIILALFVIFYQHKINKKLNKK